MTTRYHGITANTYKRFIVDAGAVYKNYGVPVRTVTLTSVIATDVLVVNGTTFTGIGSNPGANQFLIGVSDAATATNLAALIDAMDNITATADGAVITITGDNGLSLTVTTPDTTMTIVSNGISNTLLGATRDGSVYNVATTYRKIPVDGAKGDVKGGTSIERVEAKISANFVEITKEILLLALPGATAADYPASPATATHDEITRALQIALTDYATNIVIVGRLSDGSRAPIIAGIKNALSLGGFEISQKDNDEAGLSLEFTAHFDPAVDMDTEPWFYRFPKESA